MNNPTPSNKFRILMLVSIAITGLLITNVAIFVYNVAVSLVFNYVLIGVVILSHFWMHGGHGIHSDHRENTGVPNPSDQMRPVPVENKDSRNRSRGCH